MIDPKTHAALAPVRRRRERLRALQEQASRELVTHSRALRDSGASLREIACALGVAPYAVFNALNSEERNR